MNNQFICTFNEEIVEQLKNKLKLIQRVKNNNKTLYIFEFDKSIYNSYSDKEIFISNKLYFCNK